ncbi:CLUMA_CG013380, isoform A [Clunio marinus]|uniref:CLUMA_CG013380, isoform A n=1 Tax=Clunio marinus TaxID=568069 RepID=A0A1J1IIQ3_9DIPT|nr:CLUMA_CG013380, isoform A [Clunio marinus]
MNNESQEDLNINNDSEYEEQDYASVISSDTSNGTPTRNKRMPTKQLMMDDFLNADTSRKLSKTNINSLAEANLIASVENNFYSNN